MSRYTDPIVIILLFLTIIPTTLLSQNDNIKFVPIETGQGISDNYFNWIIQDNKGFMWFGSIYNGLYRYDGYNFKVYKSEPGNPKSISNVGIEVIYEHPADSGKVLWIGTRSGLNKFDREKETFISYQNTTDPHSISSDDIISICGDKTGNLWIGTLNKGLNKYDRRSNKFIRYTHNPDNKDSLCDDRILILFMDRSGILWIGTDGGGLDRFDPKTETFTHYRHDPQDPNSLSNNHVWSICEDNTGDIWMGTVIGLNKLVQDGFDDKPAKFTRFMHDPDNQNSIGGNFIKALYQDRFGIFWIGVYGDGVDIFDPKREIFKHYKNQIPARVKCIQEDQNGNVLWFATDGGGIYKWYRQQQQIKYYKNDPEDSNSLSNNYVYAMCEDKKGRVWITTDVAGINCFDRNDNTYKHYRHNPQDPTSLSHDLTYACFADRSGNLWFGTAGGFSRYNEIKDNFKNYLPDPGRKNWLQHGWIVTIVEDPRPGENALWLGTFAGGLYKFDKKKDTFIEYVHNSHDSLSLSSNSVRFIYGENIQGQPQLWIGTESGGLNKFDLIRNKFIHYKHDPYDITSLSSNIVWVVYRDKGGMLWIGTSGGLNSYNESTESFTHYGKKDGLPADCIYGILEDGHSNLWLSTLNGISRFNRRTKKFQNFTKQDGLQDNEFSPWSFMLSKSGEMFFGGNSGINSFYPDSLKANPHIPRIVLTDFQLFHESMKPNQNAPLLETISEAREIKLSYDENFFSFEFSAFDYCIPSKNKYVYRLEGVDRDWVYTDASRRMASYTRVDPGEYTFRVKGSNNDGIWNDDGVSIRIIILPPWWQTSWAYASYLFLFVLALYALRTYDKKRQQLKHELALEHVQADKSKEIDRVKSRFFANISHEFRTPLTLIEGPLKQIQSGNFQGNLKEQCKLMLNNTKRLLDLVNQLLDLSKLESGKENLQVQEISLIPLLKGLVQSFASLANQHKINLEFKPLRKKIPIYLDVEKFEKIINNLLSNAFKFTPEEGKIEIYISTGEAFPGKISHNTDTIGRNASPQQFPILNHDGRWTSPPANYDFVEITISNTGPGIPTDKINKIFDRFYQVDDANNYHYEGTGIGLALTKELVELHQGKITVSTDLTSQVPTNNLTTFIVRLPLGCEHLTDADIIDSTKLKKREKKETPVELQNIKNGYVNNKEISIKRSHKNKILVVEDHVDVRNYIKSILDNGYYILQAENGHAGLKFAVEKQPDLIISDVMMPEMDGFEFCRLIKENQQTSHIPVILLTARAGQEDRLEGLETGADDYLTKPFDENELRLRSRNLIEQRRKLRERFIKDPWIKPKEITVTSSDEKFLSQLFNIVDQDLSNSKLNVTHLVKQLNSSHAGLHRKVKALTGVSPVDIIRVRRLNRARQLFEKQFGNVSEVAFEVGFNSLSFFSHAFKKQYGITPSLFLKQVQE